MSVRTRNLFISHSWSYHDQYEKLVRLLDESPWFFYKNYSVPKNDPVHTNGTASDLRAAIKRQMSSCQVILILAGVYATYSKWIITEIAIANKDLRKPILAINPWGAERVSRMVIDYADEIVGWNAASIVEAIRRLDP